MRKLLNNKLFISSVAVALVVIIGVVVVLLIPNKAENLDGENTSNSSGVMVNSPDVNVSIPSGTTASDETTKTTNTSDPNETSDLVVDIGGTTKKPKDTDESKTPAKTADTPITPSTPSQPDSEGISIGDDESNSQYNCGVEKHHCINADNHAYIENLELQGCIYCDSHSCTSFYYVSSAGIPICNPQLCPKYNEKNDPIEYCQKCGRKNGDGENNTCQKYIVDFTCPKCGQLIKANECHTH